MKRSMGAVPSHAARNKVADFNLGVTATKRYFYNYFL